MSDAIPSDSNQMLRDALHESPDARGPVRLSSGRWIDILA